MIISVEKIIRDFEYLYFNPESCPDAFLEEHYKKKNCSKQDYIEAIDKRLGINKLNWTDYNAEKEVVDKLLKKQIFDENAIAWKAGKVEWRNGKLETKDFIDEDNNNYINGYGGKINKKDFDTYYSCLNQQHDKINENIENDKWAEAYESALYNSPKNMGVVNIINALFFITGGKAPIYDAFAHKAVKALLLDIAPSEVYLGSNPGKNDVNNVMAMYKEYRILLYKIFGDGITENGMFISRELDRALWVYGHSNISI